jgi:hypothetical protein
MLFTVLLSSFDDKSLACIKLIVVVLFFWGCCEELGLIVLMIFFFFFFCLVTKYTNIDSWYDSKSVDFGQIGGIALNQKADTITVFHRGNQIWQME